MEESKQNIIHTAYIVSGNTKYNITPAMVSVDRTDSESQIAQRVILQLNNVLVTGTWLSSLVKARARLYLYANDGTKNDEVFRGFLWGRNYKSSGNERNLKITAYDHLIYFQQSEDSLYFTAGKQTKEIVASICDKWGVKLQYSYESITNAKLPLRGKLYDMLTADILDPTKRKTGKKYVVLSVKDTMYVKPVGANSTIYHFYANENVISTSSGWSMDGVITQVIITGKADDDDRVPVEATVSGDTSTYGTLQKIQSRNENTSLADAKLEAKTTIDENGSPKWEYELTGPDIPWIRKGDKVFVDAGDIESRYLIVTAVSRSADNKTSKMQLTMEDE